MCHGSAVYVYESSDIFGSLAICRYLSFCVIFMARKLRDFNRRLKFVDDFRENVLLLFIDLGRALHSRCQIISLETFM